MNKLLKKLNDNKYRTQKIHIMARHKLALKLISNGKVLDLGCGTGTFLIELKKRGFKHIQGIDISSVPANSLKKVGIKFKILDFTVNKIPFKNKEFDFVTLIDVLEHLYDPIETLKEIKRISKKLIVVSPNFNFLPDRITTLMGFVHRECKYKKQHVNWLNKKEFIKQLRSAGFEIKKFNYYIWGERYFLIGKFFKLLGTIRPELFAASFGVLAE